MSGVHEVGGNDSNPSELHFPMRFFTAAVLIRAPTHVLRDSFRGRLWPADAPVDTLEIDRLEVLLTMDVIFRILRAAGINLRDSRALGLPDAYASQELLDRISEVWAAKTGIPDVKDGMSLTAGPSSPDAALPNSLVTINLDNIVADLTARATLFPHRAYASLVGGSPRGHLDAMLLMAGEVRQVLAGLPAGVDVALTRDNLPQDLVARMTQQLDRGIAQVAEVARWLKILEDQHPDILELDG